MLAMELERAVRVLEEREEVWDCFRRQGNTKNMMTMFFQKKLMKGIKKINLIILFKKIEIENFVINFFIYFNANVDFFNVN